MLTNLQQQPADALLALIKLHNQDPRADKIDLGVGVYKTGQGETPVFGAIKEAEKRLVATQTSKAYLGPEGDMGFVEALMPYVFGKTNPTMNGRSKRQMCQRYGWARQAGPITPRSAPIWDWA
jgi:aromatic-amino-acid transaminase